MSCSKRKQEGEEPEDDCSSDSKRLCISEDSDSNSSQSFDYAAAKTIRMYTDEERARVLSILETEFDHELQAKEDEILEIEDRIQKTHRTLQYLCYAVVSDFYSREKTITTVASTRQRRIHPAVKKLLSGKAPAGTTDPPCNVVIPAELISDAIGPSSSCSNSCSSVGSSSNSNTNPSNTIPSTSSTATTTTTTPGKEKTRKVPRYIPPKPKKNALFAHLSEPVRGGQNKVKKTLVIGNVSKWLPPDSRDDAASHKWMVYVRGPKDAANISGFVSKVRFFLHPSYRPNDVVQVVCAPFQLSRRGWGEFPVRVQIHFTNPLNKPVDIIHNLKLDRTYTGLQTLGAETIVEVWIHVEEQRSESPLFNREIQPIMKTEPAEEPEEPHEELLDQSDCEDLLQMKVEPEENVRVVRGVVNPSCCSESDTKSDSRTHVTPSQKSVVVSSPIKQLVKTEKSSDKVTNADETILNADASAAKVISAQTLPSNSILLSPNKKLIMSDPNSVTSPSKSILPINDLNASPSKSTLSLLQNSSGSGSVVAPTTVANSGKPLSLVKCIDAKGNVRFVQMTSEMIAKVMKGNTSVVQSSTETLQSSTLPSIPTDVNPAKTFSSSASSVVELQVPISQAKSVGNIDSNPGLRHVVQVPTNTSSSPRQKGLAPTIISPGKSGNQSLVPPVRSSTKASLTSSASEIRAQMETVVSPTKLMVNTTVQGLKPLVKTSSSPIKLIVGSTSSVIQPQVQTTPSPTKLIVSSSASGSKPQVVQAATPQKFIVSSMVPGIRPQIQTVVSPPKLIVTSTALGIKPHVTPVITSPKVVGTPITSTVCPKGSVPVARPLLRLVRPGSDTNARPVLVAGHSSGPRSAQPVVGRLPIPSNGNRPLLMLKDGKLYLMKQNTALESSNVAKTNSSVVSTCTASKTVLANNVPWLTAGGGQIVRPLFVTQSGQPVHPSTMIQPGCMVVNNANNQAQLVNVSKISTSGPAVNVSTSVLVKNASSPLLTQPSTSEDTALHLAVSAAQTAVATSFTAKPKVPAPGRTLNEGSPPQPSKLAPNNTTFASQLRLQTANASSNSSLTPRAFAGTSAPSRLPGQKSLQSCEQVMQAVNGNSAKVGQRVQSTQASATAIPGRLTVKPGMSLLKSGVSLLKSNVGIANSSPGVSATSSPLTSPLVSPCPSPTVFNTMSPTSKRVILGRASGSSTITSTTHRARVYRELLSLIVKSCPREPKTDIWRAVRWLVRSLPLVHEESLSLEYKILHPYCAPDEKTFCSWNVGKQRACELLRAKTVHKLLEDVGWSVDDLWTTKEIAVWARFHGYTPGLPVEEGDTDGRCSRNSMASGDNDTIPSREAVCEYSAPTFALEWLTMQENDLKMAALSQSTASDSSDEEIDILSSDTSPSRVRIKEECSTTSESLEPLDEMPIDPSLQPLAQLVTDTLKTAGFKLAPEQIVPGVLYPAAQRVLMQVVKSLADDLVRRAFASAWGPSVSRQPSSIDLSHICQAILNRPELDLLTCAGLGIGTTSVESTNPS